jgi:superfamily II DNA/RNA helicase
LPLWGWQSERNAAMAGLRELRLRVLVSTDLTARGVDVGLYPIVTFQYNSTTSYQVSYHIK